MKLAYKVVDVYQGKFVSLTALQLKELAVEYRLGEVARPSIPKSKLFVYDNLESACRQNKQPFQKNCQVLLCEVGDIIQPLPSGTRITPPWYAREGWGEKELWWPGMDSGPWGTAYLYAEDGVCLVDWVKPLEVISL